MADLTTAPLSVNTLAQVMSANAEAQQAQQALASQNYLRRLVQQPGAVDDKTGLPSANTLSQFTRAFPQQGIGLTTKVAQVQEQQALGAYRKTEEGLSRQKLATETLADSLAGYDADIKDGMSPDVARQRMMQNLHEFNYSQGLSQDQADKSWQAISTKTPAELRALSMTAQQRLAAGEVSRTFEGPDGSIIKEMKDGSFRDANDRPIAAPAGMTGVAAGVNPETASYREDSLAEREREARARESEADGRLAVARERLQGGGDLDNETKDFAAQLVLDGKPVPNFGYGPAAAKARVEVLKRAAELGAADSGSARGAAAGSVQTGATIHADTGSLSSITKIADASEAFENTAMKNFDTALKLAPKGIKTDMGPFVEKWVQGGESALGDPDVPPYAAALLTGANEYAKVIAGSTGSQGSTVDSRREAADMFNRFYNTDQIEAVVKVAKQDMDNKKASYLAQRDAIKDRLGKVARGGTPPPKSAGERTLVGPDGKSVRARIEGGKWVNAETGKPL